MTDVKEFGSTTIVSGPSWTGRGFTEPKAHSFWLQFPESLQAVAIKEIAAGNRVDQILRNHERGIVVVALIRGPLTGQPPTGTIVHTEHRYGNYCYDDTVCTYEDTSSGCFLAFLSNDANSAPSSVPPNER